MGVITPPGCTQRPRPAGRWWRNLRAAWRCRARGRSLEVGGQGGHGGRAVRGQRHWCAHARKHTQARGHGLCTHTCRHACADVSHMHSCMRAQYARTNMRACAHPCTRTRTHTTTREPCFVHQGTANPHGRTHAKPHPSAAHARSQPRARECTHGSTRGCAQPRAAHAHDLPPPPRPPNTACQRRGGEEAGGDTTGWDGEARGCREWVPGVAGGNADCAAAGGAVAERLRAVLRDLDVAHEAFAGGDGVSSPPTDADTDAAAAT